MMAPMRGSDPTVISKKDGSTYVLRIIAHVIDSDLAAALRGDIEQAMKRRPADTTAVVVDVSEINAMCSAGFESLLLLYRLCKDASLKLSLRGPRPEYLQLLQRMGFLRLFTVEGP